MRDIPREHGFGEEEGGSHNEEREEQVHSEQLDQQWKPYKERLNQLWPNRSYANNYSQPKFPHPGTFILWARNAGAHNIYTPNEWAAFIALNEIQNSEHMPIHYIKSKLREVDIIMSLPFQSAELQNEVNNILTSIEKVSQNNFEGLMQIVRNDINKAFQHLKELSSTARQIQKSFKDLEFYGLYANIADWQDGFNILSPLGINNFYKILFKLQSKVDSFIGKVREKIARGEEFLEQNLENEDEGGIETEGENWKRNSIYSEQGDNNNIPLEHLLVGLNKFSESVHMLMKELPIFGTLKVVMTQKENKNEE